MDDGWGAAGDVASCGGAGWWLGTASTALSLRSSLPGCSGSAGWYTVAFLPARLALLVPLVLLLCSSPALRCVGDSEIRGWISMGRWLCLGWLVTGLRPFMAGCLPFRRYGPAAFVAERRESETNRAWSLNTRAWSMEPRVRDHSVVYGTEQYKKYYCNGFT